MATETLCSIAACCTTLSASAVFPIDGRAARMIKSPRWNPAVRRSRSVKPLATPVSAPCVVWSCSIRSIVGQISSFSRMKELIWPTMERIEQLHTTQGALTGVASGFTDLDRLTAGFQRGDLIILAARPSMGKTALALNVVQHAAIEHNVPVAIFSLEMSKEQLVQRLLCSEGLVDAQRLRRGQLRDDDYPKLARAAGLLGTAPIWIDDSAMLTPLAMRSKARRLKAEHDIGLVVVDYLQMMQGPTDSESRQQELSFISRSLKALATEPAL